jgi:hypothetical protein
MENYALNDRCGHMNALLSMGNIANDNNIKTYDQELYETKSEGDTIKIKI